MTVGTKERVTEGARRNGNNDGQTHTHTHAHSLSLSHSHTHTLSLTFTRIHTHSHTHVHTHTHYNTHAHVASYQKCDVSMYFRTYGFNNLHDGIFACFSYYFLLKI